jgi:anti-sigma factor RsiW
VTTCSRFEDRLEAFHDDELSRLSRWRVARHVAGCARCGAEVAALATVGQEVREEELRAGPGPDLWASIAMRLPALDAELDQRAAPAAVVRPRRVGWAGFLGPLPVGIGGLAAAAIALVLWLRPPLLPPSDDVVEELDAMGRPVAVLPSDEKSTIIWVLDPSPVANAKESGGALL